MWIPASCITEVLYPLNYRPLASKYFPLSILPWPLCNVLDSGFDNKVKTTICSSLWPTAKEKTVKDLLGRGHVRRGRVPRGRGPRGRASRRPPAEVDDDPKPPADVASILHLAANWLRHKDITWRFQSSCVTPHATLPKNLIVHGGGVSAVVEWS